MADSTQPKTHSPLNPNAPSFRMPPGAPSTTTANGIAGPPNLSSPPTLSDTTTLTMDTQPDSITTKNGNKNRPQAKTTTTEENIAEAGAGVKLTGAQLKKQKAAEKAARRADKVAQKGEVAQAPTLEPPQPTGAGHQRRPSQSNKKETEGSHHRRTPSGLQPGAVRIPIRPTSGQPALPSSLPTVKDKSFDKRVPMLSHLYPSASSKRAALSTASREIHPAVLTLALQLRDFVICGSNARTVATLLVLKRVIQSYSTPPGVALSRHLTIHLSHQITFLSAARPLGVPQGNSIRWLKKLISQLDPDLAESEAKLFLSRAIDTFIREKITLADEVISREAAGNRIEESGDVILTFGKSSIVEKTLVEAMNMGKEFKVIVVDSRPLFEGKNLARSLLRAGMTAGSEDIQTTSKPDDETQNSPSRGASCSVQYTLLSGLSDVLENSSTRVTKVFLGASAMLGNGRLSSRAGTALVACMAKNSGTASRIPVIVLCESVKFTSRVALDSIAMNEIGDPDALVERRDTNIFSTPPDLTSKQDESKKGGGKKGSKDAPGDTGDEKSQDEVYGLEGWRDQPNLYLLNLMYDVTPSEYIDMVICELGTLPPAAVPVVNGVHGEDE